MGFAIRTGKPKHKANEKQKIKKGDVVKKWRSEQVESLNSWNLPYEDVNILERMKRGKKHMVEVW
jgi:hypothetical protein